VKLAVIGAGWAGLAAALSLQDRGANVTVFEAAPLPGGRARGVDDIHMGNIDNGQHLMLGAYTETIKLIESLHPGQNIDQRLVREPLHLESADGTFRLHAPRLPAPFNTLVALLFTKGLPTSDRVLALRMMVSCRLGGWQARPGETAALLLSRYQQSTLLSRKLWSPLCLAALNTPLDSSCAQLFLNVLRDSLDAHREASDLLIPRLDLTELWPAAASRALTMRYRHLVRKVQAKPTHVEIDGEVFDGCVVATPPYAAARILFDQAEVTASVMRASADMRTPEQESEISLFRMLGAFNYRAIATLTLELESDWRLPRSMMMLDENHSRGHVGQWVFNRIGHNKQITVVISDSSDFLKQDRVRFVNDIASQVREQTARHPQCKAPMPDVRYQRLIVEKRATFDATPDLARPANRSPWPRITLAGDWTDTGYPAVLEGAVRSGRSAAAVLLRQLGSSSARE
jgi:squalene-associated FAD-dependent desaturase